jgi:methionyl-tRNA synthetase
MEEKITIDDFCKVEMKVARVINCEKVEKSNKLLKFDLDLGNEQRIILSGIAKFYSPDALIGKNLIVVTNLAPRTIAGIESNGMILSAINPDETQLSVLTVEGRNPGDLVC